MQVIIHGLASGKSWSIRLKDTDLSLTVLNFLRSRDFPMASSCRDNQICKKCYVNTDILSCNIKLSDYIKEHGNSISIDYL